MAVIRLIFWLAVLLYSLVYFVFSVLQIAFGWFPEKPRRNRDTNGKTKKIPKNSP